MSLALPPNSTAGSHEDDWGRALAARIDRFTAERTAEAETHGVEATRFVRFATSTLQGGKRLRARFCATGWRAAGGVDDTTGPIIDACAALEVFQAAALVHDDIIDSSDTRRGRPAAHRALETSHLDADWHGDAAAFGRSAAILLGDLLLAWSSDLFDEALDGTATATRARAEYALMRREVMVGQYLDVAEESSWASATDDSPVERALRVASLKSARYSVQQPLVIGAALAGGDDAQLAALRSFGHPVGLAFQLRDDVLGVFGDEAETGKPAGDDLREGKRTLLIAYARETADAADREFIDQSLGSPALDEHAVRALREILVSTGALGRVEAEIVDLAAQAEAALDGAPLDPPAVTQLRTLVAAATDRAA
ncbi:MAG: polyprenyl synthetase family protein [Microbacterium sp.]